MKWEDKLAALNNIAECSLKMRYPGDWYVSQRVEVGILGQESPPHIRYGKGSTPEEAVEDHWKQLAEDLPAGQYLVATNDAGERISYRWGGYMWMAV